MKKVLKLFVGALVLGIAFYFAFDEAQPDLIQVGALLGGIVVMVLFSLRQTRA